MTLSFLPRNTRQTRTDAPAIGRPEESSTRPLSGSAVARTDREDNRPGQRGLGTCDDSLRPKPNRRAGPCRSTRPGDRRRGARTGPSNRSRPSRAGFFPWDVPTLPRSCARDGPACLIDDRAGHIHPAGQLDGRQHQLIDSGWWHSLGYVPSGGRVEEGARNPDRPAVRLEYSRG